MILVVGNSSYGSVVAHLDKVVYAHTLDEIEVKDISMAMFTGGEDVHPDLYGGADPDGISYTSKERDLREMGIFADLLASGVKLTGICRGFQFLNVMCGGQMYQHIFSHAGVMHSVYYPALKQSNEAMSTHHQLVKLPDDAIPVAWSVPNRSHAYYGPKGVLTEPPVKEIESAIFRKYNAFGVQYHPEMMKEDAPGRMFYTKIIGDFYHMDIDEFVRVYGGEHEHKQRRTFEAASADRS